MGQELIPKYDLRTGEFHFSQTYLLPDSQRVTEPTHSSC